MSDQAAPTGVGMATPLLLIIPLIRAWKSNHFTLARNHYLELLMTFNILRRFESATIQAPGFSLCRSRLSRLTSPNAGMTRTS